MPAVIDDPKVRRPDTTFIETELGWHPQVEWAEGIQRTVDWFTAAEVADDARSSVS